MVQEKPDWGHGPNKPIPLWREEEIRKAMAEVMPTLGDELKIDAVIDRLKLFRLGA